MKVVLTNLSNELYASSRHRLNDSAKKYGIEDIRSYDFEDIRNTDFFRQHEHILTQPRGLGYWLWKPYLILKAMETLQDGDIVIYCDCGLDFIADINPLIKICKEQPVLLFANGNLFNSAWVKRDCFILMDCDNERYWKSLQVDAAFNMYRKSKEAIHFLEEWLRYGSDERIITDLPNTCGKENLPDYIEHRWDQAILSLLAHKMNIELYRVPTQFGNHYKTEAFRVKGEFNCVNQLKQKQVRYYSKNTYENSPYFQLLNHHRSKDNQAPVQPPTLMEQVIDFVKKSFGFIKRKLKIK